jgi:hypothetical protein
MLLPGVEWTNVFDFDCLEDSDSIMNEFSGNTKLVIGGQKCA